MAREIKSTIDTDNNTLTIEVIGKADIVVTISGLRREIRNHSMLHGLKQKICDSAALGAGYTLTEKYNAMVDTFERITGEDGQWNKGATGGNGGVVGGLLFKALCRLYPEKSADTLRAYHDKLDKSQQAALRKNPKIAPIIEEIKSESINTKGIDTGGMLDELDELEGLE